MVVSAFEGNAGSELDGFVGIPVHCLLFSIISDGSLGNEVTMYRMARPVKTKIIYLKYLDVPVTIVGSYNRASLFCLRLKICR